MRKLIDELQVMALPDSPCRRAMLALVGHANLGSEFDAVADCGGGFYLLEEGDNPASVRLYDGGEGIDLTDLPAMCYEFVDISDDGGAFVLFWATGDEGGPVFFVPNEDWVGDSFLRDLFAAASACGDGTVPSDPGRGKR